MNFAIVLVCKVFMQSGVSIGKLLKKLENVTKM